MIHNDHLGTPQKMTDSSGEVVWSADYKPFGEATVTISTITNNLRFPGQYYDAETGLNYNYYRDYNPVIGRYIESDPLMVPFIYHERSYFVPPYNTKKPSKFHNYLYVGNNPVKRKDPKGLYDIGDAWDDEGTEGISIVEAEWSAMMGQLECSAKCALKEAGYDIAAHVAVDAAVHMLVNQALKAGIKMAWTAVSVPYSIYATITCSEECTDTSCLNR